MKLVITSIKNIFRLNCIYKQCPSTPTFSPMKQAQLRSTYLKQLGELRDLHDGGVLSSEEYEEQRSGIVNLLRQLK